MRFCMIGILMLVIGCTDNDASIDASITNVDGCVRAAIRHNDIQIERIMRWVKAEDAYFSAVHGSNLVDVANRFVTNAIPWINCVARRPRFAREC